MAVGLGWAGEDDGDVAGEEADGEDGDGDAADDADAEGDACDGDAEVPAVGAAGPVAAAVFSIMAACFPLAAACRGTYALTGDPAAAGVARAVAAPWAPPGRVAEVTVCAFWSAAPLSVGCGPVA